MIEHALALDLVTDADGGVAGVTLHVIGEGQVDGVGAVLCRAVVLATGGLGQVFSPTHQPRRHRPATAWRWHCAPARRCADLEFVQFHPTVLWLGEDSQGQQPLISEAVRGEGAFLVDGEGRRFMDGVHPLADLAPRDVVAKAITPPDARDRPPHVWLDARHLGGRHVGTPVPDHPRACPGPRHRPGHRADPGRPCRALRLRRRPTDLWGRTTVPGLYACGEVACTGVHGANRLASNSLLEGLVFARADRRRAARGRSRPWAEPAADPRAPGLVPGTLRPHLQELMTDRVGVLRSEKGLASALADLDVLAGEGGASPVPTPGRPTNLLAVSRALAAAASLREETRGSHWREDHPDRDDVRWSGHVDVTLADGLPVASFRPAPATDGGAA